jgi:hypothetical protein
MTEASIVTRFDSHRAVLSLAVVSAACMIIGALGAWVSYEGMSSSAGGLDRGNEIVSHRGWVVLIAGMAGAALALFASRSILGSAIVALAGIFASRSVLDARHAVDPCPSGGGGNPHTLGLYCSSPSVGWGLNVATIGSFGLVAAGVALLWFAALPRLPRLPRDRRLRDLVKKYAP